MERELYRELYLIVWRLGQKYRSKNVVHSDAWVVLVYFWAVLHDRPIYWACRKEHWPQRARVDDLPSPSTMSRRLRRPAIQAFLDAYGTVRPLNQPECRVAIGLVAGLGDHPYVVADGEYDKNALYDQAGTEGLQIITPRRKGKALGHRRDRIYRIAAYALPVRQRANLPAGRSSIERCFGTLCSGTGGLLALPSWVRRLRRVRQWVQAKIIVHYVRASRRNKLRAV